MGGGVGMHFWCAPHCASKPKISKHESKRNSEKVSVLGGERVQFSQTSARRAIKCFTE